MWQWENRVKEMEKRLSKKDEGASGKQVLTVLAHLDL